MPPIVRDGGGRFRATYGATGMEAFLIRPDGYLGTRVALGEDAPLLDHLDGVFAPA
jgi:hypothetical protein